MRLTKEIGKANVVVIKRPIVVIQAGVIVALAIGQILPGNCFFYKEFCYDNSNLPFLKRRPRKIKQMQEKGRRRKEKGKIEVKRVEHLQKEKNIDKKISILTWRWYIITVPGFLVWFGLVPSCTYVYL